MGIENISIEKKREWIIRTEKNDDAFRVWQLWFAEKKTLNKEQSQIISNLYFEIQKNIIDMIDDKWEFNGIKNYINNIKMPEEDLQQTLTYMRIYFLLMADDFLN